MNMNQSFTNNRVCWILWVSCFVPCHHAIVPSWVQNFFLWVFCGSVSFSRGSKVFSRGHLLSPNVFLVGISCGFKFFPHGYFVGPKFFLLDISWAQTFSRGHFVGSHFFSWVIRGFELFLAGISWVQNYFSLIVRR